MSILPKTVEKLIEAFQRLPGIGPKTASRLTFYMLHLPQPLLESLGTNIINLKKNVSYCSRCFNITEDDPCLICRDDKRDESLICVVENPLDILQIEKTAKFKGIYHVLHGAINPLNNIGPDEIKIAELTTRIKNNTIKEIILATNPNMEGEATAMYIKREIGGIEKNLNGLRVTRLAHGLPVGADIEYADEVTLSRALEGRRDF